MGATSEWPVIVNQTIAGVALEHRARTVGIFWERFSARGAQRFRRDDRFASRQVRRAPSQLKVTTLGSAHAVALDRLLRKIGVNLPHFRERGLFQKKFSTVHFVSGSTPAIA